MKRDIVKSLSLYMYIHMYEKKISVYLFLTYLVPERPTFTKVFTMLPVDPKEC